MAGRMSKRATSASRRLEKSLPGNIIGKPVVATNTYPLLKGLIDRFPDRIAISTDWKGTSYDPTFVIVNRLICWKDLSMDFVTGLPICTDWKGTSYDSIPADENGRLQAGADNDRCTRACGARGRQKIRTCSASPPEFLLHHHHHPTYHPAYNGSYDAKSRA